MSLPVVALTFLYIINSVTWDYPTKIRVWITQGVWDQAAGSKHNWSKLIAEHRSIQAILESRCLTYYIYWDLTITVSRIRRETRPCLVVQNFCLMVHWSYYWKVSCILCNYCTCQPNISANNIMCLNATKTFFISYLGLVFHGSV